jgi:hypothetical protein
MLRDTVDMEKALPSGFMCWFSHMIVGTVHEADTGTIQKDRRARRQ